MSALDEPPHIESEPLLAPSQAMADVTLPASVSTSAATLSETLPYHQTLTGFLFYSAAAETFSIVSVALFLPIALEAFARENGRIAPAHRDHCSQTLSPSPTSVEPTCEVHLLGIWLNTSSFSLFTYSISVLSQALVFITLGSQANHPSTRKTMLFTSAAIGSSSMLLLLAIQAKSSVWPLIAVLSIIANVAFGLGNVCLNAYLPALARNSPQVQKPFDSPEKHTEAVSKATSYVSALGIGVGYSVGLAALILCLIPVLILHGSTHSMRIAIASSGAWWAVLSIPAFFCLKSSSMQTRQPLTLTEGWKGVFRLFKEARQLGQTTRYLSAYVFLSDSFATVMSTATLFAKTVVRMKADALILVGILAPLSGIVGAFLVPQIAHRMGASNLKTLIVLCSTAAIIPAYGCVALVFTVEHGHFGSLSTHAEIYGFAMLFGFLYGAFQSYSRALYAELIPSGEEARFFSLYAITDKSSSFLGPFLVALIADWTGNLRAGFVVILCGLTLPLPILAALDVDKGRQQAADYRNDRQMAADSSAPG